MGQDVPILGELSHLNQQRFYYLKPLLVLCEMFALKLTPLFDDVAGLNWERLLRGEFGKLSPKR
jgi:hypothetical protein